MQNHIILVLIYSFTDDFSLNIVLIRWFFDAFCWKWLYQFIYFTYIKYKTI